MRLILAMLMAALLAPDVMGAAAPAPSAQPVKRTRAEVEKLIEEAGKTPPEWWESTPLKYPDTLDLSWTEIKGWHNKKHIMHYIHDFVRPNPARWREGIKLVHHSMAANKGNAQVAAKVAFNLADMYQEMLEDHPRAAFWARKVQGKEIILANAYWKMGSREMAVEVLNRFPPARDGYGQLVKLWAEMGDLKKALQIAEAIAAAGGPDAAYMAAGDVCRTAGQYPQALAYYQKVLAAKKGWRYIDVNKKRAQASIDAVRVFDALDLKRIPDGTYKSSSIGYNAQVEVAVTIRDARIEKVEVTRHKEKQFYTSLTDVPALIIEKQGLKGVDGTTGATVTSEAIIYATGKALGGAMK